VKGDEPIAEAPAVTAAGNVAYRGGRDVDRRVAPSSPRDRGSRPSRV